MKGLPHMSRTSEISNLNFTSYFTGPIVVTSIVSIKINLTTHHTWSRDSSVGIATGYGLDYRRVGIRVPVGSRIFSSPPSPDWLWGPPNLLWVPGALSPGVKRLGREADNSPPASAEVKKMWIYISTPLYSFIASYLIS
jgi:hypothetical protein